MALGGPEFVTFIVRPKEELRARLLELGDRSLLLQELLLCVRRCDVRVREEGQWKTDDYRTQVQLGVLAELYEFADDDLLRDVFGTSHLSIDDVNKWWDVDAIEYDDILDLDLLLKPPIEKADRLPTTNRPLVDEWFRELRKAIHSPFDAQPD